MLKTGWKNWDKHLSQFINTKNTIMEIGSYKGDATCWFLNNLCKNSKSLVIAIDTWEGSPEYNIDFKKIEKEFDDNIKNTKKESQLIKMKKKSSDGLVTLLNERKYNFNIIFIDASHEAPDVINDAILSWQLLENKGVLIFDDYEWDKLNKEQFKPKIAIDSFINIFKLQLKVLYKGYQIIIQKDIKPELIPYYKIIDIINRAGESSLN
jgi:predicted O-methyltransferase YrrM